MSLGKKIREKSSRRYLPYLCGALMIIASPGAWAADNVSDEYTFDEVVVTATKIAQPQKEVTSSVSVITQEMIRNSTAQTVAEILPTVPGVAIQSYGGLGAKQGISIRGLNGGAESQKMLILVDGRPANGAFKGSITWNTIPLSNIERIEVVRGPASVLYGDNALGGAINIITKKPEKDRSTVSTSYGSWGTKTMSLYQEGKSGNVGYTFTADYGNTDGFRPHSDYEGSNFTSRFDIGNNLIIRSGYTKFDRSDPGTSGIPSSNTTYYKDYTQDQVEAYYFDVQKNFKLADLPSQVRVFYNETDTDDIENLPNSIGSKNKSGVWGLYQRLKDKETGFELQQNVINTDKQTVLWGYDYRRLSANNTDYAKNNSVGVQNTYKANTYAFYLEDNKQLSKKLRMDLGGRYDHHSAYGGQFNPKFGMAYQAQADTTIKLNISRAFKAPSMNDLYYGSSANPDLKPQRMWSYELGVDKQFTPTSKASIVFYKENVEDMIVGRRQSSGGTIRENASSMRPKGVEMEWVRQLSNKYDYFVNYTYLDAGLMTFYSSRHKANLGVNYKYGPWKASLMEEYVGSTWDNDAINAKVPRQLLDAYLLTNLKLTYSPRPQYEWSLGIENLFNRSYEQFDYEPMPGRAYTLTLTSHF